MQNEELASCNFCSRKGRKRNLARVTWLVNGETNDYCPHCLDSVLKDMMTLPWTRKYGYKVDYPYKK